MNKKKIDINEIICNRCNKCDCNIYGLRYAIGCVRCGERERACRDYIRSFSNMPDTFIYKGYLALKEIKDDLYDEIENKIIGERKCKCKVGDIYGYGAWDYIWVCCACKRRSIIPVRWLLDKKITNAMLCKLFPSKFTTLEWSHVRTALESTKHFYDNRTKGERMA